MSLLESPYVDGVLLPVFVYGTLQPDEVRWFAMEGRLVDHEGAHDHVRGRVWDTGLEYPALTLDSDEHLVPGRVLHLLPQTAVETWLHLVDVEQSADGDYVPTVLVTEGGVRVLVFVFSREPKPTFVPIRAWRHGPVA